MATDMIELKVFLVRHGLTQADLAEGCGLSEASVSGLISGRIEGPRKTTIDSVLEFCRQHDPSITYEQLFGGSEVAA